MIKKFLPKEYDFYNYFEEHIVVSRKAAAELLKFTADGKDVEGVMSRIKELEKEGDAITHKCTDALHLTFITPIERTSIFRLIKQLDNITDNIYAAVFRFSLYQIEETRSEALELAKIIVNCIEEIEQSLKGLRNMKNAKKINEHCIKVRELENQADELFRQSLSNLFKENQAMLVIKWKEVFEKLERAVNSCENVTNIIEAIIIEAS
jgi:hypothetical protein